MKSNAWISLMGVAVLLLTLPLPALAALGGDVASVQDDQARMKGTLKTTESDDLHRPRNQAVPGTRSAGICFPRGQSVWRLLARPSLSPTCSSFLAHYFDAVLRGRKTQRTATKAAPHSIFNSPDWWLSPKRCHMRSYSGRAYDPEKLPQGVDRE